jgi:hypothetical protein
LHYYFATAGAALLAFACWLFWRRVLLLLDGVVTHGRIESYQARELDDSKFYLPVVTFRYQEGNARRFTAMAGGTSKNPPEGTNVPVRYLRTNPEFALIDNFLNVWAGPLAFAVLGIGGLATLWAK